MAKQTEPSFWNWLFRNSCCCGDRGKGKEYTEGKTNKLESPKLYSHLEDFPNDLTNYNEPVSSDRSSLALLGTDTSPFEEAIEITKT